MRVFLAVLFSLGLFSIANAECIPKDDAHKNLFFSASARSGISQVAYEKVLDKLEAYFAPVVRARGARLQINRLWNDGTVNAQAYRIGSTWHVDMFGGLARYPGMTQTAFLTVACHELGHHMGGAPRYDRNTDWAATEGQADYWATLNCMKRLGVASSAGSLALAKVLADLSGERMPSRSTRSQVVRSSILESHPPAQCRLDTMDAGRACRASGNTSNNDPRVGTCHVYPSSTTYSAGSRPRCFYKP